MKSETHRIDTLEVEITNISKHGFWIFMDQKEYFLPFKEFPWFEKSSLSAIFKVERLTPKHLYWPELDIDLSVESIENPERFPLVAKTE